MVFARVWIGSIAAVVGVALFAGCSSSPVEAPAERSAKTEEAYDPVLCMGNVISSDPWLVDSTCSCPPGGTQEFQDACSYEQGLIKCLEQIGYPLSDCSPGNLPYLWFVLGSDKQRWSVLDPGYVWGSTCDQQAALLQCMADLNATGTGPDGVPYTKYPVEAQEVPYCSPPRWGCHFDKVDAFDPCGFRGCIQ